MSSRISNFLASLNAPPQTGFNSQLIQTGGNPMSQFGGPRGAFAQNMSQPGRTQGGEFFTDFLNNMNSPTGQGSAGTPETQSIPGFDPLGNQGFGEAFGNAFDSSKAGKTMEIIKKLMGLFG